MKLIETDRLTLSKKNLSKKITYHDPCYLGRGNNIYNSPRELIKSAGFNLLEMKRSKKKSFCCGAGGAQMFKEPEKGNKDINIERTEEAVNLDISVIATSCPFCNTMLTDGIKNKNLENKIEVLDIVEIISRAKNDFN